MYSLLRGVRCASGNGCEALKGKNSHLNTTVHGSLLEYSDVDMVVGIQSISFMFFMLC